MPHAFRIGPLVAPDGDLYLYATTDPTGLPVMVHASDDLDGLRQLGAALPGQSLTVEPELAKAGKQLGWRRAPLPAALARAKATLALTVGLATSGTLGRDVGPTSIGDLLDASIAFVRAAPWRLIDGDTPLRVDVLDRGKRRTIEGSLMGQAGLEFGFLTYAEPGTLRRLMDADPREAKKLARRVDILAVSMEHEPAWILKTIERALGTATVPLPMRSKGGRHRPVSDREVATLAACLRAASELVPGSTEVRGKSGVEPQVEVVLHLPAMSQGSLRPVPGQPMRAGENIGRNAPCPCGSGRKYKRCCQVQERTTATTLSGSEALVQRILVFADARFEGWRSALPPPWIALAAQPGADQLLRPLLAFQREVQPGLTAMQAYAAEHMQALGREALGLMGAELQATLSVWEVLDVREGVGMLMLDLLAGDQRFVQEVSGSRGMVVRDAMLARVTTEHGHSTFSGVHPRPLPPALAHAVVTAVRRRLGLKVAPVSPGHLAAPSIVDAMLSEWQVACEHGDDAPLVEREVQTTDGEPFQPHEDHFSFSSDTRPEIIAIIIAQAGVNVDEQTPRGVEVTFTKPGNAMHQHWRNTVIGTATIEARRLKLTANSEARIDRLRGLLEHALGSRIEHRERKRSAVETVRGRAEEGPLAMDAMALRGLWAPPVELLLREQARHWVETPSPVLGGLTPRQAATKAASRRTLHQLLKETENASARSGSPDFTPFVRHDLELSSTGERERIDPQERRTGRGRKISETLLEFAAPLLEELDDPALMRPALELAALVWNTDVLERDGHASKYAGSLLKAYRKTALHDAERWVERLRERRRLFVGDARLIELRQAQWHDGNLRVQAAALLGPPPVRRRAKGQTELFE